LIDQPIGCLSEQTICVQHNMEGRLRRGAFHGYDFVSLSRFAIGTSCIILLQRKMLVIGFSAGMLEALSRQRLVEVADQIVGGFEADRQADHVVAGAGGNPLLVGQLTVRRRRGMQN
jgi:hypothetical protein